jgi:hypothetical protein
VERSGVSQNRVGVTALSVVISIGVLVPVLARWIEWIVKTGAPMAGFTALLFGVAAWAGLTFMVSVIIAGIGFILHRVA